MADAQAAAAHAAFVEIGRRFLTESWSYLGTAAIFVFLRTFARWKVVGFRNFKPDDYLMFFALVSFLSRPLEAPGKTLKKLIINSP